MLSSRLQQLNTKGFISATSGGMYPVGMCIAKDWAPILAMALRDCYNMSD